MFNISLENISKSPKKLKSLLSLIILLPFWYCAIFFLHPDFYNDNHYSILLCISFCMSVFFTYIIVYISITFMNIRRIKSNKKFKSYDVLNFKIIYQAILYHLLLIMASFSFCCSNNKYKKTFFVDDFDNIYFLSNFFWRFFFIIIFGFFFYSVSRLLLMRKKNTLKP